MKNILVLGMAILCEVLATTSLKYSEGFTKPLPCVAVVLGYGAAFYLLSITLKVMPIGVAYAIWAGVGIVLTAIIGLIIWREPMDWIKGLGIGLIVGGAVLVNLCSKSPTH